MLRSVPAALIALGVVAASAVESPAQDTCDPNPAAGAPPCATAGASPAPFRITEEVVVRAVRADEKAPVSRTEIRRAEIEERNYGQEMPYLLKQTPGLTFTSDTGTSAGYAYLYIRGIPQTRINMTLDGVPLNEPEDQALYFVDFGDFTSSLESIEVQRGVGTSPVGTASYGGAVSFESLALAEKAQAAAEVGLGSFDTQRGESRGPERPLRPRPRGLCARHVQGHRRLPRPLGRAAAQPVLRRLASGRTLLSQGVRLHRPRTDPARVPRHREGRARARPSLQRDGARREGRLRPGLRAGAVDARRGLGLEPRGAGLSHQRRRRTTGSGPTPTTRPSTSTTSTGGCSAASPPSRTSAAASRRAAELHANDFASDHCPGRRRRRAAVREPRPQVGAVGIRARRATTSAPCTSTAMRSSGTRRFRYEGDVPLGSVDWTFFNPRLGLRWDARPSLGLFASVGRASREPARSDMLAGEDNASLAVRPRGGAARARGRRRNRRRLSAQGPRRSQASVYAMEFRNEIAQTGELSEIGLPLRRNVDRSHRRGLELELRWEAARSLRVSGTANLSANAIGEWQQFYDVYGPDGSYVDSVSRLHRDVDPLLTPRAVANLGFDWTPRSRGHARACAGATCRSRSSTTRATTRFTTPSHFVARRLGPAAPRPLDQARRAAAASRDHEPAEQRPRLADRLQLPVLRPRRGRRRLAGRHPLLLSAGHARRVRGARTQVLGAPTRRGPRGQQDLWHGPWRACSAREPRGREKAG